MARQAETAMHGTGAGRGNRPALPGTQKPRASEIEAMIRVDHAGELGAVCIYEGQLAVLSRQKGAVEDVQSIRHMAAQEQGHFDIFDAMVKDRAVRPTALEPVWRVAGFALGAATALMGRKAAMACTVAVEDVIDEHYSRQIDHLGASEPELKRTIQKFHADECAHRDAALERGAEQAPAYPLLSAAIRFSCRVAIALSERV